MLVARTLWVQREDPSSSAKIDKLAGRESQFRQDPLLIRMMRYSALLSITTVKKAWRTRDTSRNETKQSLWQLNRHTWVKRVYRIPSSYTTRTSPRCDSGLADLTSGRLHIVQSFFNLYLLSYFDARGNHIWGTRMRRMLLFLNVECPYRRSVASLVRCWGCSRLTRKRVPDSLDFMPIEVWNAGWDACCDYARVQFDYGKAWCWCYRICIISALRYIVHLGGRLTYMWSPGS